MTLTKEDVRAIRACDSACVHFDADKGTIRLRLIERRSKDSVFTEGDERERVLEEEQGSWEQTQAFWHVSSARYHGGWMALALLVREGDELRFRCGENDNGYVKAAMIPSGAMESTYHAPGYPSLHFDCLWVSLIRKGKLLVDGMELENSICPRNTARAIQYIKRPQAIEV